MSRPIYFTRRRDIRRSDVSVRFFDRPDETLEFELGVDLEPYRDLPPSAKVVVECYTNTHLERFSWGTVEHTSTERRGLAGLSARERPLFRVKVIESGKATGRLLAAIHEVRAEEHDSLLPIIWKSKDEMDQLFWLVHFVAGSEPQPELWMNKDVPGLFDAFRRQDSLVFGLVLPTAYKTVLQRLIIDGEAEWVEDNSMLGRWLQSCRSLGAEAFDDGLRPGDDDWEMLRVDWIDDVVRRYARTYLFLEGVTRDLEERK